MNKFTLALCCVFASFLIYAQPSNDNFNSAATLTVGDGSCAARVAGTLIDATDSGEGTPSGCGENYTSDVWYSVEVPASGNLAIETFNVGGNDFDSILHVYTGSSGNLTQVACDDQGGGGGNLSRVLLTGRTPSETLYVRVWGFGGVRAPFEICAWSPNANDFPANNDFAGATVLTVGNGSCTDRASGDLSFASDSGETTPSDCGSRYASDVWYQVVVPNTGEVTIETFSVVGENEFDSVMYVYTGSSGSLTQVACDDDGGGGNLSRVLLTGRTPSETLYVRVWGFGGERNPFEICAWSPTALSVDTTALNRFVYYPNPVEDILQFEAATPVSEIRIYSLTGKVVLQAQPHASEFGLDVSVLPSGVYMLQIEESRFYRLVKK